MNIYIDIVYRYIYIIIFPETKIAPSRMGWKTIVSFWDMITCCRVLQISLIPICEVGDLTCMREFVWCPRKGFSRGLGTVGMNQPISWEEISRLFSLLWIRARNQCHLGKQKTVVNVHRCFCFPCCFPKIYIDTSVTLNRKNVKKT